MIGTIRRFGGMICHPRKTLLSILAGQGGSMFDLLPWIVLVAAAVSPKQAGQVILVGRMDIIDGVRLLLGLVSTRMGFALLGAFIAAFLLSIIVRIKIRNLSEDSLGAEWSFDRCLDACVYLLVPFLLLVSISVVLETVGVNWWFLPHRTIKGTGVYLFTRVFVAFGWSLALYVVALTALLQNRAPERGPEQNDVPQS